MARRGRTAQAMQDLKAPQQQDYSDAEIIAALKATKGLVTRAADRLKCAPSTIYRRLKSSDVVADALSIERERTLDTAEEKLIEQIKDGNTTALIFFLKTQGKRRGYVERTEVVNIPADIKELLEALGIDDTQQMWGALRVSLEAVKQKREIVQ